MDYEADIEIDENALDVEWLEQPRRMLQYARHAEQTRKEMDWAKEQLELTKANLDKAIRADPEAYDISRVSEAVVQNAITRQQEYQDALQRYLEAKYEAGVASAAVRAFDQRKVALENLVRLHGQQYFAGPSVPRNLGEERQAKQKQSDQKVSQAMKRKERGSDAN